MMRPTTASKKNAKEPNSGLSKDLDSDMMISGKELPNVPRYKSMRTNLDNETKTSARGSETPQMKGSKAASTNKPQPNQKRQSVSRQVGFGSSSGISQPKNKSSGFGARTNSSTKKDTEKFKKSEMISGIGLSKYRNEDICNELTFSKEGMRLQSDAKR